MFTTFLNLWIYLNKIVQWGNLRQNFCFGTVLRAVKQWNRTFLCEMGERIRNRRSGVVVCRERFVGNLLHKYLHRYANIKFNVVLIGKEKKTNCLLDTMCGF